MATIGNPSAWDNASDIAVGDAKGQTFTAPWDFNRVEFLLATYGNGPQTVWIIIYAGGATGSTQVAFLETTATDNGWCGIDLATPLAAGSYHATVVNRGTTLAVWTNSSDATYTGGTATVGRGAGGSTQPGDRAFIVTEAGASLTPVEQTLPVSWNVLETPVPTQVSQTLPVEWNVFEYVAPTGDIAYHRRSGVFSTADFGTLNVFWPDLGDASPLQNGDVVFALAVHNEGSSVVPVFPSEWALVGTTGVYSGTQRVSVFWRRLTGAVSGSFPVQTFNATAVQLFSFRGARGEGLPFDMSVVATQPSNATSTSVELTGFTANNPLLLTFGARNATQNVNDTLSFSNVTGGTDVELVDTTNNSNVSAILLAAYRKPTAAIDPVFTLTYGSTTGNPTSGLILLGLTATTTITATVAVSYDVKQRVASNLSSTYVVKQSIAPQQTAASWHTRQSVAPAAVTSSWHTAQRVNPTLATAWHVRIPATKSAPASWKVRAQVSTSVTTNWAIKGGLFTATLAASWKIDPISAPFVFGYDGAANNAENTQNNPGQVFTSPVRFNQVKFFVATFGAASASAQFTLYNSAAGSTIVAQQTLTFGDNSWVTMTLPTAQVAGTYRVVMTAAGGFSTAWWSNTANVFNKGYATSGTTQVSGDRVFQIVGSLNKILNIHTTRYANLRPASVTVDTAWAVGSELTRVTGSLSTTWVTSGLAVGTTQNTWDVVGSNQVLAKLESEWRVRPYETPFVWGFFGPENSAVAADAAIPGQVFTAPVSFSLVEMFVATFGAISSSARFTLYAGATSTTIVSRQTITFNDNSWAGISFARQPAGVYRMTMEAVTGQSAWWSSTTDLFSRGFAVNGASPAGGDRLFRITGATQPVSVDRSYSHNVIAHVVGVLTSTYNTETITTVVSNTVETEWITAAQVKTSSEQTWNTTSQATTSLASSYQTLIGVAEDYSTTWATMVDADRAIASTWKTASAVVASPVSSTWTVRQQAVRPLIEQTWRVAKQVAASAAATWAVRIPAASSSNSTWVVARQVVVAPVSSTWVLHKQVTRSIAPAWRVTVTASRSLQSTFTVFRPASASLSPSYRVLKTVTRTLNPTFNVRVPMSPSALTETWNLRTRVGTSSVSSTYAVSQSGQVTSALPVSYRVRRRVTASRPAAWHVRVPVGKTTAMAPWRVRARVTAPSATAWHVRRPVAQPISQTFRVRSQTGATRPASWKVYAPVPVKIAAGSWNVTRGVQASKVTSFRVLKLASAAKGSAWNVRTPVRTDQGTWTWQVLQPGPQVSIPTSWKIRDQITASTSTRWNVESNLNGQVNIVVEMANFRTTTHVRQSRVVAEVPSVRVSTEVSGGSRAVPVAANE